MAFRHTLLVVDDEPNVIRSVQDLLRLDYQVFGAAGARAGMEVLRREEVHVVMTDQRMPGMTGVELLSQIRGSYPDAIRLLFTGHADIQAVIDAINEGNVFRYIVKPWEPEELQGIIRQACEHYDLIVERKKLLTQLQRQNRELEKSNAELRAADELKYAFLQVASHELRTPLAIVMAVAYLAAGPNTKVEDIRAYLGRIQQAGRRLEYSIKQMETVLAARQIAPNIERHPTDVHALLQLAAEEVRPFVEIRKQRLSASLTQESVSSVSPE